MTTENSFIQLGARTYDPEIGRFMSVDPLFELFPEHSPYQYAYNSPLIWSDPSGMFPEILMFIDGYRVYNSVGVTITAPRYESDIESDDDEDTRTGSGGGAAGASGIPQWMQDASARSEGYYWMSVYEWVVGFYTTDYSSGNVPGSIGDGSGKGGTNGSGLGESFYGSFVDDKDNKYEANKHIKYMQIGDDSYPDAPVSPDNWDDYNNEYSLPQEIINKIHKIVIEGLSISNEVGGLILYNPTINDYTIIESKPGDKLTPEDVDKGINGSIILGRAKDDKERKRKYKLLDNGYVVPFSFHVHSRVEGKKTNKITCPYPSEQDFKNIIGTVGDFVFGWDHKVYFYNSTQKIITTFKEFFNK